MPLAPTYDPGAVATDHDEYCRASRRLFPLLALGLLGVTWIAIKLVLWMVSAIGGFAWPVWLHWMIALAALAGLAWDGRRHWRALEDREAWWRERWTAQSDEIALAERADALRSRGLLSGGGRRWAAILGCAPRLLALGIHIPRQSIGWFAGDVARAQGLFAALGRAGEGTSALDQLGTFVDLLPAFDRLGLLERERNDRAIGARLTEVLRRRYFAKPKGIGKVAGISLD
ncbi:MAG: hypothetical protein H0W72_02710 [Planctomycetes bacterium]|nr:hypothetical protein [Planctomycetota bacterium]